MVFPLVSETEYIVQYYEYGRSLANLVINLSPLPISLMQACGATRQGARPASWPGTKLKRLKLRNCPPTSGRAVMSSKS